MLQEERATRWSYDASLDVVRLRTDHAALGATLRRQNRDASLLLDVYGFLVGIELYGEGGTRKLVMCGPHEAVESQKPGRVEVAADLHDTIAEVVVRNAGEAIRGREKNPYLG